MSMNRRDFIKANAVAAAAATTGIPVAASAANAVKGEAHNGTQIRWDKAACRFCGTGCSVMVATKENRVVATHGDIKSALLSTRNRRRDRARCASIGIPAPGSFAGTGRAHG